MGYEELISYEEIIRKLSYGEFEQIQTLFSEWYEAENKYCFGESIMPDAAFDDLKETLLNLSEEKDLQYVIDFVKSYIPRKNEDEDEETRLISLKKFKYKDITTIQEVIKFLKYKQELVMGPKYDGISLKISLNDNILIQTKGGINVTSLLRNNKSIDTCINDLSKKYKTICGELLIPKTVFEEKYSDQYENPRNFVSAAIHENDDIDIQDLVFKPCTDGKNLIFENIDFKFIDPRQLYKINEGYIQFLKSDKFPFLCDGIVVSYNETGKRQVKDNYPLNTIAIKFPSETARTEVIDMIWTQKKSGRLSPVLLLKPVKFMGTTVTRCNAYNYNYVISKKIGIGSTIEIQKSGDIIPAVTKVITKSDFVKMPDVEYKITGVNLFAVDNFVSVVQKFINGLKNFGIDGIGPELSKKIGEVCNYDIIRIFDISLKPSFVEKLGYNSSAWNKFKQVYEIKNIFLNDLIYIMQFDNVGVTLSDKIEKILTGQSNDTSNIPRSVMSNVISNNGEGRQKLLNSMKLLKEYGIRIITRKVGGKSFTYEMSGEPEKMHKKDFEKFISSKYPSALHTSIKKDTNFLFVDDVNSNTGKATKARKYNVKILTYSEAMNHSNLSELIN